MSQNILKVFLKKLNVLTDVIICFNNNVINVNIMLNKDDVELATEEEMKASSWRPHPQDLF